MVRLPPAATDFPLLRRIQSGQAVQSAMYALFTDRKRPGREADQPPPSSVVVKNEGRHASIPHVFMASTGTTLHSLAFFLACLRTMSFAEIISRRWQTKGWIRNICRMILTGGRQGTWRNPVPVPLYPPQISHGLTMNRTWVSAVRERRLTVWAMTGPHIHSNLSNVQRYSKYQLQKTEVAVHFSTCVDTTKLFTTPSL